jgi:hypothetical protein
MPVVQISYAPSRALYEKVAERLNLGTDRPGGLVLHAASEMEDGRVEIVDVYESAEAVEAFTNEKLFPVFEAAGVMPMVMEQGRPVLREPFDYIG